MNKLKNLSIDKKIRESKFNINKNFIYFLIAPLVFIIVGIILLCTVGFNLGTDFTGASVFKIYINNEASFNDENIKSYDLENKDDYNEIYDKIYYHVIAVCVKAIEKSEYAVAYQRYKESILQLEEAYVRPALEQRLIRALQPHNAWWTL